MLGTVMAHNWGSAPHNFGVRIPGSGPEPLTTEENRKIMQSIIISVPAQGPIYEFF